MQLVFVGPPGAGKGTVAKLLSDRLGVAHLSSGDLLREALRRGDPIGKQAGRYMREGVLAPDELVTRVVLNGLGQLEEGRSVVLDGFPRTAEQAKALDASLEANGRKTIDRAIDFEVSTETIVRRLNGRRVCGRCGANYHVGTLPPRQPDRCDRCAGPLTVRPDDQPQTVLKRLEVYRQQAVPLLDYYRAQGKLRSVSGDLSVEEEYQGLVDLLEKERLLGSAE